ncbi:response regulator [Ferruginibacter sp.]
METKDNNTTHHAFIIDDEADICFLLSNVLKQQHIASEYAFSLKDAGQAMKGKEPEIIFLDNHLPDGLGINYISRLKEEHPSSKIVMVTAHDTDADRENALKAGADFFIGKPFSRDAIYNVVNTCIA